MLNECSLLQVEPTHDISNELAALLRYHLASVRCSSVQVSVSQSLGVMHGTALVLETGAATGERVGTQLLKEVRGGLQPSCHCSAAATASTPYSTHA